MQIDRPKSRIFSEKINFFQKRMVVWAEYSALTEYVRALQLCIMTEGNNPFMMMMIMMAMMSTQPDAIPPTRVRETSIIGSY